MRVDNYCHCLSVNCAMDGSRETMEDDCRGPGAGECSAVTSEFVGCGDPVCCIIA